MMPRSIREPMLKWFVWDHQYRGLPNQTSKRRKEKTYKANIYTRNAASSEALHRRDHLVEDLRGVGLHTSHDLQFMGPALRILSGGAFECHVRTVMLHLLKL